MKDYLISREALLNDLCEDREEGTFEFTAKQAEAVDKVIWYINDRIQAQPSVPAVPLDKLCEWLAAHYEPPANVSHGKALDDHEFCVTLWRYVLEKMMEEQDAVD